MTAPARRRNAVPRCPAVLDGIVQQGGANLLLAAAMLQHKGGDGQARPSGRVQGVGPMPDAENLRPLPENAMHDDIGPKRDQLAGVRDQAVRVPAGTPTGRAATSCMATRFAAAGLSCPTWVRIRSRSARAGAAKVTGKAAGEALSRCPRTAANGALPRMARAGPPRPRLRLRGPPRRGRPRHRPVRKTRVQPCRQSGTGRGGYGNLFQHRPSRNASSRAAEATMPHCVGVGAARLLRKATRLGQNGLPGKRSA